MALIIKDRVKETTTTTGTGNIALGGAVSNFVTFSSVLSDSDTTYYAIVDSNNSDFEVGLGTYVSSGNTIARTTVLASSNSGSAVDLSAGSKTIFCAFPADKAVIEDANGVVSIENLQFDTNAIKSTNTNGNIQLFPAGTGFTELYGNTNAGAIRFNCESNSHGVTLKGPPHSASATYTLELPNSDGSAGQLLKTDGSGKLAFTSSLPGITATASEINILDGVTATTAELNYVDGVTSNIQTQIDSISPSPTFTATASGALANGDKVILNSNGTVSVIDGATGALGSATTFTSSGNILYLATTFDSSNNRIVLAYRDQADSNKGKAVVGTISGTSISFGSAVVFNATNGSTSQIAATFDSNSNKVVLAYAEGSVGNKGTAVVGTVSGTSISFGTAAQFENAEISETGIAFDSSNNKVVIAYKDHGNSSYGTAIVGTVSGTDISFGTAVVYESANSLRNRVVFDSSNNKIVIGYRDGGNSSYGTAIVGTVSGTSISFGSAAVFESGASIDDLSGVFDTTNNKVVFAYRDEGTSPQYNGNAVVGTVSGTSISFGTPVEFHEGSGGSIVATSTAFSPDAGQVFIAYSSDTNQDVFSIAGTVSGTSITFDTPTTVTATASAYSPEVVVAYDTNANAFGICYDLSGIRAEGKVQTISYTNLTSDNFIGISDAAYSDGDTATIQIIGAVDDAQSSLSVGSDYYVQSDGTLNTTADAPSVYAGTAISATKLAIQYPARQTLTHLSTVTASGASTVDVESTFDSTYDAYKLIITDMTVGTDGAQVQAVFKIGGSYLTSGTYDFLHRRLGVDGSGQIYSNGFGNANNVIVAQSTGNDSYASANFEFSIYNPADTAIRHVVRFEGSYYEDDNDIHYVYGIGQNSTTGLLTGIRFQLSTGTISGKFRLYGITNG